MKISTVCQTFFALVFATMIVFVLIYNPHALLLLAISLGISCAIAFMIAGALGEFDD